MKLSLRRAIANAIESAQSKPRIKPKFHYEKAGIMVHAKCCLNKEQRAFINSILAHLQMATDPDQRKQLMALLPHKDLLQVPVQREHRIDYSRYTGEKLREIRAQGGGKRERARRARQQAKQQSKLSLAVAA